MTARHKHPEWRGQHLGTKFPFEDSATLVNDEGLEIPADAFLDATLYPVGGQTGMRLSAVTVNSESVTLWIGDEESDFRCFGEFSADRPPEHVRLTDEHGRGAGLLVSSQLRLAAFSAWPSGEHAFTLAQSSFVAEVCNPTPEKGVRGIMLEDGSLFVGDVLIVGDDGVMFTCETVSLPASCGQASSNVYTILAHATGDPLFRRKTCSPGLFETPRLLEKITFQRGGESHVCHPGPAGEIKIYAGSKLAEDSVLRVRSTADGLLIEAVGESLRKS